jgi:hypothetical protein
VKAIELRSADVIRALAPPPEALMTEAPSEMDRRDFTQAMGEFTDVTLRIRRLEAELTHAFQELNELQAELLQRGVAPDFGPVATEAYKRFSGVPFWDRHAS